MTSETNKVTGALIALLISAALASAAGQSTRAASAVGPDVRHGQELFKTCLVCHGIDGMGTPDGNVPIIAGQFSSVIVKQVTDFRTARRWDVDMERVASRHILKSAQDIVDVAAYASRLEREGPVGTGDGDWLLHGAEVYAQKCASCHGSRGEGSAGRVIPKLARQHYAYILRQMYDSADGRRPNMKVAHIRLIQSLVVEDFQGIADYLSRIEPDSTGAMEVQVRDVREAILPAPRSARRGFASSHGF